MRKFFIKKTNECEKPAALKKDNPAFTFAEGAKHVGNFNDKCKAAFTLAEVSITLAIVGIVAVIVLPPVINNIRDMEYATARRFVLKNLGEAGRLMGVNGTIREASSAQDFVENHLSKQLKIIKTCSNDKLKECGIMTDENGIFDITESRMTMPTDISQLAEGITNSSNAPTLKNIDTSSYGFVMANGYAINLFYNPNCLHDTIDDHYGQNMVCMNAIYDINGLDRPNQVGKDIGFVTVIYPDIQSVAVAPDAAKSLTGNGGGQSYMSVLCANYGKTHKGYDTVPSKEELLAMYYNSKLLKLVKTHSYWSASSAGNGLGWRQNMGNGRRFKDSVGAVSYTAVHCIRR